MILIGLTGGIACGKSTVSSILKRDYHMEIIDADAIVRELQSPGAPCTRKIAQRWPESIDPLTGALRREALGRIIFKDVNARRELAKIMNPRIFRTILERIAYHWWKGLWHNSSDPYVVILDAPTLFETGLFTFFISNSLVVGCSEQLQITRLHARNRFSEEEALNCIRCQMSLERKRRLAGYVIENDESGLEVLERKVAECVEWIQRQGEHKLNMVVGGILSVCVLTASISLRAFFKYCI
ncbi:unnamed protein product [Phytomonas sp. Hart1]|nr:unnamed protein product [Phytomonas sp. Hart1]|eukprot:CCW66341.1 unnamed protein product [Phytomonas sp. isolate Hart1]